MSRRTTNFAFWLVLSLTAIIAASGVVSYWRSFTTDYTTSTRCIGGGLDFGYIIIRHVRVDSGPSYSGLGLNTYVDKNPSRPTILNSPSSSGWDARVLAFQRISYPSLECNYLYIHFGLLIVPLALWAYILRHYYRRLTRDSSAFPVEATTKENPIN